MREVCLCKNTSMMLARAAACPTHKLSSLVLAAIDASSGGGLLHLRFSTALFAALAGERRATRYHPCTAVASRRLDSAVLGQRSKR